MADKKNTFISWNVNGIRAIAKKGLDDFFKKYPSDIYCFQEIKANEQDIHGMDFPWPEGYEKIWYPAEKKGYSGTGLLTRLPTRGVSLGMGEKEHDREGRVITVDLGNFYLVNVYTPNSQPELTRLDYRVNGWDPAFRGYVSQLAKNKPVVICGDLNVAHKEIDLANPQANRHHAGFTDEEREGFSKLLAAGFLDTFRMFDSNGGHYTWWSYMNNARAKNIGWRIDYFCVSRDLENNVLSAGILPGVMGSDHCPVTLEIMS